MFFREVDVQLIRVGLVSNHEAAPRKTLRVRFRVLENSFPLLGGSNRCLLVH